MRCCKIIINLFYLRRCKIFINQFYLRWCNIIINLFYLRWCKIIINLLFSLGLGQNQSFGPKQNTKFGVRTTHPPTTHHPPKTLWRVLGIVGGQDLVCRLPIVQGTSAHSFDPPFQIFWPKNVLDPKFLEPNFFY